MPTDNVAQVREWLRAKLVSVAAEEALSVFPPVVPFLVAGNRGAVCLVFQMDEKGAGAVSGFGMDTLEQLSARETKLCGR